MFLFLMNIMYTFKNIILKYNYMRKYIVIISMVGAFIMSVGMLGAAFPAYALPPSSITSITHTDGTFPSGSTTGQVTATINIAAPRTGNMVYLSINTAQLPSGVHAYFSETNSSFISKNASVQSISVPITITSSVTASGSFAMYAELDSAQDAPLSSKTDVVNVAFNISGDTVASQNSSFGISVTPASLTFNASKPMPQVQTATVSIVRSSNGYTGPVSITTDQSLLQDASVVLKHVQGDTYTATVTANMAFDSLDGSVLFTAIAGSSTPEVSKNAVLNVIVKKSTQPTLKFYIADTNTLLQVGTADQLKAIYNTQYGFADVSSDAIWSSSNTSAITVRKGKAVAVGQGSATITASFAGMSDTIELSVQATPTESSLIITSPNGGSFAAGSTISFGWRKSSGVIPLGSTYAIFLKDSNGYTTLLKMGVTPLDTSFSLSLPSASMISAGTYYLELDFINQNGLFTSAQSSAFVVTSGSTTIPSFTITAPNGGQYWQTGTSHVITWQSSGMQSSDKVWIYLVTPSDTMTGGTFANNATTIASGVSNTGSYTWTIPQNITTGNMYKIMIGNEGLEVVGKSGSSFTIVSNTVPTPTPSITAGVFGGPSTVAPGSSVTIMWTSKNITSSSAQVGILSQGVSPYIAIMQPINGSFTWNVPANITPGTYTIVVSASGSGMNTISTSFPITVLSMVSQAPTFNEQMASILNSLETLLKGFSF